MPSEPAWELLRREEARAVLAELHEFLQKTPQPRFRHVLASTGSLDTSTGGAAPWEVQLRQEFLSRYGPPLLPLPDSLERSRLFMALKLSPHYMGPGIRDAARELFTSPAFLASISLSVLIYFAAWTMPEPVFSKAFAAALTVRLALAVGVLELRQLAMACLRLYEEAEAASSLEELEAVAERFGRAMGGAALRVLVLVASFGVAKVLPSAPQGGLWSLLTPPRYAMPGGLTLQATTTAQMVADGTLVMTGVTVGTAASSLPDAPCSDGREKKDGFEWHHVATDKNDISSARGGPWTPRFLELFNRAGLSLDAPENRIYLKGHQGPHPEAYHKEVHQRLLRALGQCRDAAQCRSRLVEELKRVANEVCTRGSRLHRVLTKSEE
jgi:hypothetical protein